MTNDKEVIELCAKALGYEVLQYPDGVFRNCTGMLARQNISAAPVWNPRTDQLDSDNMACDLEIDVEFFARTVNANSFVSVNTCAYIPHDGTTEGRRAAVREARALVAAEMGRAKL